MSISTIFLIINMSQLDNFFLIFYFTVIFSFNTILNNLNDFKYLGKNTIGLNKILINHPKNSLSKISLQARKL